MAYSDKEWVRAFSSINCVTSNLGRIWNFVWTHSSEGILSIGTQVDLLPYSIKTYHLDRDNIVIETDTEYRDRERTEE